MDEPELSCQEVVELVTAYVEGALDEGERARFEAHLDDCPGCVAYVEQMRTTLELAGRIDAGGLSDEAQAGLLAAFRRWRDA